MTNLFENLNDKNIEKLKQILHATTITYRRNVNVMSNVNKDDFIAIVDKGSVQLELNDYNGNKTIIDTIKQGEIFGTMTSPIKNDEVSCITKEDTQITFIEYGEITSDEIIKTDFYIIFVKNLIKLLSEQINIKNYRIELLTKKTTRDKLLEYFKGESQKKGSKTFSMSISFTELSNLLAVDRSAMTREIAYLKEDGFIKITQKRITLLY